MRDHIHPLPVCGFGQHRPHAPACAAEQGRMIACGKIVDPDHPNFGMALCRHEDPPPAPPVPPPIPPVGDPGNGADQPDSDNNDTPESTPDPSGNSEPGAGSSTEPEPESDPATEPESEPSVESEPEPEPESETLPEPEPEPEAESEPIDWWKWIRRLFGFVIAGLLAFLVYWLWFWLKKIGFWTFVLEQLWRLYDWLNRLRDWINGPPDFPTDPPPEVTPEPEPEPEPEAEPETEPEPEPEPEVCVLTNAMIPANMTPIRLARCGNSSIVRVYVAFDMDADFSAACSRCEYRQYVRGKFEYQTGYGPWQKLRHTIPLTFRILKENVFQDDGYGHRGLRTSNFNDRYEPRRSDGCTYIGHDEPSLNVEIGDALNVELYFQGYIFDIDPTTGVKTTKFYNTWTVMIRGRVVEKTNRHYPWPTTMDLLYPLGTRLELEPI